MTKEEIYNIIDQGINQKQTLILSVRHGLGSVINNTKFDPYIVGDDTYQFQFAWGYLPEQNLFYKFDLDNIESAKLGNEKFEISEEACYQYAIEEEHFAEVEGFKNIFMKAAITTS
jgi:hypothetical protein